MKNRNSFLLRNLHDLESDIGIALSRPYDSDLPHHRELSRSIQRRFLFLRNLLSAETASNPRRPQHSHYLESRLAELEAVFRDWEGHCKDFSATDEEDHADEGRSVCSCPESWTEDGGSQEAEAEQEGSADWDSLADGEFERALEEEEDKRLVEDQVENVAVGGIEDISGKRGRDEVIQMKTGNPPPPKHGKLLTAILVGTIFWVILATVIYWECFRDMQRGDQVVKIIPT